MRDKLKRLCALSGVSGDEMCVSDFIIECVKPYADEITTDILGNVTVLKKGAGRTAKKLLFCAHMDEVGIIVTDITEDGFIKFACVGGIDRRVLPGKSVLIGKTSVYGVFGCRAYHLVKDKRSVPEIADMYIDIGAKDRKEAEMLVALGDTGSFDNHFVEFGDGFVRAKAIDDRFGCAVLLKLIESALPVDCMFAFTTQEEVGTRGAAVAAYRMRPDIAIVIEGTTAADLPSVSGANKVCKVNAGAVIPFMDGGTIYDKDLIKTLTGLADKNNIPWQTKTRIAGATDGAVIQRSRSGVQTAAISAPVRNLHSPSCVGAYRDFESVYKLAELFLHYIGESAK